MCASFRRASRALSQMYDDALRPFGLRISQFTILQMLTLVGEAPQGRMAEMLAMDSTSLTRTLGIMLREGWVVERRGEDRRERWLSLSKAGRQQYDRALSAWEKTQKAVGLMLGDAQWGELMKLTNNVTKLTTK